MGASKRYSAEVRERAVRMVAEHLHENSSQWPAIVSIAAKIGCTAESLRRWVHGSERDSEFPGRFSSRRAEMSACTFPASTSTRKCRSVPVALAKKSGWSDTYVETTKSQV